MAANCGEEVIAMEAKLKADSLTPEGFNRLYMQYCLYLYTYTFPDGYVACEHWRRKPLKVGGEGGT